MSRCRSSIEAPFLRRAQTAAASSTVSGSSHASWAAFCRKTRSGSGMRCLQQRQLVLQPHRLHEQRDGGHGDVGLAPPPRGRCFPVKENSPSSGDWKSWKTASSPVRCRTLARAMLPLKKKISAMLLLAALLRDRSGCPSGGSRSASGSRWPGRRTAGCPGAAWRTARGTLRVVASRRRASTRQRFRGERGQRHHQVEEDRLLEREELGLLGRAHRGRCAASP